jgi:hypothetical protein
MAAAQCLPIADPDATPSDAAPWRGSAFNFMQTLGASTLSRHSTLSYDPLYAMAFDLCLQWYFRNTLKASVEQVMDVELTDSNSTTTRHEPVFGDTSVRIDSRLLTHTFSPGQSIGWNAGFELLAPTSPASQAASMVAATRVRSGVRIATDDVLANTLSVLELSYLRRFSKHTTVQAEAPYPCAAGAFDSIECRHLPSATNLLDSVTAKLRFYIELVPQVWLDLAGALVWSRGYSLDDAEFETASGADVTLADRSATRFRNTRTLQAGVVYDVTPFISLELYGSSDFAERNLDGSLRGPFRVADTSLGLDAWFDLEALYATTR